MRRRTFLAAAAAAPVAAGLSAPAAHAASLRHRAEGTAVNAVGGAYQAPFPGALRGKWLIFRNSEYVTLRGRGYFWIRWEPEYWMGTGQLMMPTWSGASGTFLHVGSGGGHRMNDAHPNGSGETWLGKPGTGFITMPSGEPMIWGNEFYYLDGQVTLTGHEAAAKYNLGINDCTWQFVQDDLNHAPESGTEWVRYGVAHDM